MVFCNMEIRISREKDNLCHNPYFNRWFSAIKTLQAHWDWIHEVTILILIDGFLQ